MIDTPHSSSSPGRIRSLCRANRFNRPTAGLAVDYVQANLVVLPAGDAEAFESFCRLNPKPCPLLEVTPPGKYEPIQTAPHADLRTDLPRYRVFENGVCVDRPMSISHVWRDDFVAFLIGCSFTFESALIAAHLPVRHVEEGKNVPMYRTDVQCKPAPPFAGPMVVSMRPMTPQQAKLTAEVTGRYPDVHGAPAHIGDPSAIGIDDIAEPDYGDAVTIRPGEIPVFWACGVTPMEAISRARPQIAITHEPGHMFITDVPNETLRRSV